MRKKEEFQCCFRQFLHKLEGFSFSSRHFYELGDYRTAKCSHLSDAFILFRNVFLVILDVSFYYVLNKNVFIFCFLRTFQRIVIVVSVLITYVQHRKTIFMQDKIHQKSANSAISITERVYGNKYIMNQYS